MIELVANCTNEVVKAEMDRRFTDTLGKRARILRTDLGLRQVEVADAIGIRGPYLSEIENDKAYPAGEVVAKLARALNTTADYLLLLTDNDELPKDNEPTYVSEEAERAARMIDEMPPDLRAQAVGAVAGIHEHYQEHARRDRMILELLTVIEASQGVEFRRNLERQLVSVVGKQGSGEPLPLRFGGNGLQK